MKTNNEKGRSLIILLSGGLLAKEVIGLVVGILSGIFYGGIGGAIGGFIGMLILDVILIAAMYSGLRYINYGVCGIFGILALYYLLGIINIFKWITFIGVISLLLNLVWAAGLILGILLLVMNNDVKEHFTNEWSEIGNLIQK
ncbi:MAG: hypothetical protein J6B01_01815 [Ruminococcus sp.]|nr:hypothetical protein [Ruminococcus sp.]MBP3380201.1 hypothetical protein [Ruminococcus sp.]